MSMKYLISKNKQKGRFFLFEKLQGRFLLFTYLLLLCLFLFAGCTIQETDSSFSFIYMGDSQADPETGDYKQWGQLLRSAAEDESKPAFVMIGGDLVNDGSNQQEWDAFFESGGEVFKHLPLYPAMGNHDNNELYKEIFELPENGPAGKEEAFYSFDHGDVHFTVMDSNVMGAANPEDIEWLKKDLSNTDRTYKIVMFHHPAYPAVDIPKDIMRAETIRQEFIPIMETEGVNLVLSGHQHVYMRTHPIKNRVIDENGIIYLIGVSGGKQYTPDTYDYIDCTVGNQPVYSIISIDKEGISIKTKNKEGKLLDQWGNY
jgi:3',5'-cyclic AMP phosphodiesterase CpdA